MSDISKLVERARFLASGQDDPHSTTIDELCNAIENLKAALNAIVRRYDERSQYDGPSFMADEMAEIARHVVSTDTLAGP